jgi:hypothetical protein
MLPVAMLPVAIMLSFALLDVDMLPAVVMLIVAIMFSHVAIIFLFLVAMLHVDMLPASFRYYATCEYAGCCRCVAYLLLLAFAIILHANMLAVVAVLPTCCYNVVSCYCYYVACR